MPVAANPNAKSRMLGGLLNLLLPLIGIPGVGRIYMGYVGLGIAQLLCVLACGVGALWSFIDGIIILTGGVKVDGQGNELND